MSHEALRREPIAIVGIGARYPGANDPGELWTLIRSGTDAIREVPRSRFDIDRFYHPTPGVPGKLASRWGGFIDGIELFDAAFFGISPREAIRMDPQQRLALEAAWSALDDGGHAPHSLRGTPTGVFLGAHRDEYGRLVEQHSSDVDLMSATGLSRSGIAGRISYALGLEGPSLVFDTDRSSSLVAVHAACRSLLGGECTLALAGGVNLVLTPEVSLAFSRAKMLAPDGRIKFCDARADGIVRSDGVGIVVLETLSAAVRNGDPIYALILGGAINHDAGRSGDLMTPSSASQSALLNAACLDAGVSPHDIQYVEAHGTGTIVGDPVEVEALARVLQQGRAGSALRIGSIKTNIGHTESAAGIAGLIKVALAMKHRSLPASLHFTEPNPRISFGGIEVQRELSPWPDERLLAGVTSLGLTGLNAHVILESAPPARAEPRRQDERVEILTLSARGRDALAARARQWVVHLRGKKESISDVTAAAALRCSHLEDRIAVVGATREELARELETKLEAASVFRHRPQVAFVFPGHGTTRVGQELLESVSAFRASMMECDVALKRIAGWSLLEALAQESPLPPRIVEPTLVALEISLAAQWRDWGIEPDVVVGISIGEVAAAQVAGALSIADAMLVLAQGTADLKPAPARVPMIATAGLSELPAAIDQLLAEHQVFLEVSPEPVTLGSIEDLVAHAGIKAIAMGSLRRNEPHRRSLLRTLGALYTCGLPVKWDRLFSRGRHVELPAYPWQRRRYWIGAPAETPTETITGLQGETPRERRDRARELVKMELTRVLGISGDETIDTRRSFRELGVTSLMATELVSRVGMAALDRALPSSVFFNHPNVEALTEYLVQQHQPPAEVDQIAPASGEPIAVVGIGCRLPGGADGPEAFWKLLSEGVDAIREVPADRWDLARWYHPESGQPGKMRTRWGGFLEHIDRFDAAFFGISPREAEEMDPQQRLLLEVAFDALERAGQAPDRMTGTRTGVFLGLMNNNDYASRKRLLDDPSRIRAHHGTGIAASIAAGRLAYQLGVTGPALSIDTACSSSLVAIHLAMQSLRRGECSMALAGGVNAILSPEISVAYSQAGMLSPSGRCKTFDASADGYVRSEGCGVVVLERLSDAIARGGHVLALLIGAAINQDGRSSGLTAPNGLAQRAVVRSALADAGVSPAEVGYVEAHGTGTPLGDPIELSALGEIFDAETMVGSVKTNIGHLEAAAGVAGLIKVILALQRREIPPHLHLVERNPQLARVQLQIPTQRTPWTKRRVAGVSSFGFSGTNAHLVVAESPALPASEDQRGLELVVLSAKSEGALHALAERHAEHLAQHGELSLSDVAFTLGAGRSHHDHRWAVVAGDREELIGALRRAQVSRVVPGKTAWLFTGQGAQRVGMGRALAKQQPVFASALERACTALNAYLERGVEEIMWAAEGTPEAALLDQTGWTQPALFAVEIALAALWRSWGMEPDLVAGHSVGELAAAHVAGVLSLEDAARLVAARARAMQALSPGGAMFAIAAAEAEVRRAIDSELVSIAAINGPSSVVISGDEHAVVEIAEAFAARGARTSRLAVSHAFQSPLMDPMLADFRAVAEKVRYRRPELPGVGNVEGVLWGSEVSTAEYWVRHVRAPVRFADGVRALHAAGARTFVELGPKPTLLSLVPACLPGANPLLIATLRSDVLEERAALEALGAWYVAGGRVGWEAVARGRRVVLPTYPWQRDRHWIAQASSDLLGEQISVAGAEVHRSALSLEHQPWLADHRLGDDVVVPAAVLLELMSRATEGSELRSVAVTVPLVIAGSRQLQTVVTSEGDVRRVRIYSRGDAWIVHAEAEAREATPAALVDLDSLRARCSEPSGVDSIYDQLSDAGLKYGPAFRCLRQAWRGPGELLAYAVLPEGGPSAALLDAALQAAVAGDALHLPFAFERAQLHAQPKEAWIWVQFTARDEETLGAEVTLTDASGRVFASLSGFRARKVEPKRVTSDSISSFAWRAVDAVHAAPLSGRWVIAGGELAASLSVQLAERGAISTHATRLSGALPENVVCVFDGDRSALQLTTEALEMVKVLAAQPSPPRVWWMTRGAIAVGPQELPSAASSLWGLGRTLMLEHPELSCSLTDLPHDGEIDAALSELTVRDDEREVAWRGGKRHAARLERAPESRAVRKMRTDGTVLVTGALGGVGVHVARWLVERGVQHLLLTSRRGEQAPGAEALLRELGSAVTITALDVTDRGAIASLLASLEAPLRAVFHAAGEIDDGVLIDQSAARLERVFAAKVRGACHLDELTRDLDLDAFVLFSSIAASLGSAGQGPYAAANAFLDGLAANRRARGLPATSVAFGPWAGTGMAGALDVLQQQRWERRGIRALSPARAIALLEAALDRSDPHLVLAPIEPARARTDEAPPREVLEIVRAEIAHLLGLDGPETVAVDRPLSALGLDSLMALELRNALGKRVGITLPATLAFDHPTASAIAERIRGELSPPPTPAPSIASADEPIAIIGFGCRFPGGVIDGESFWRLLSREIDAISVVPRDRFDVDEHYDPDPSAPGKMYTREGGFLAGLDQFEPEFFEITPREAVSMDPQQRLLLETSWEALERAGIPPDSISGASVGVFVGLMSHEYLELSHGELSRRDGYVTTGGLGSVASGRISYALGVRGPSMTIDTACSSSLVAAHVACQSLRSGECDLALAGGATVVLTPSLFVEFSRLRGLSRDGRCKSFDASADGVSWSEGCGVLALKRLSDAERDGDRVLALIVGSAVNQDGKSQGLTAPNGAAQQEVIRQALARAQLPASAIDYVEAHGTGTKLGDPIEMQALGAVMEGREAPLIVGSLKSNIGHAQAAAGVGGIIKTLLALQHERIPRSLHFREPSPHIAWSELPVRVAAEAMPWMRSERTRRAGVSSFGISGTNAHLVLEEAPLSSARSPRSVELLVVSAKSEAALAQAVSRLSSHLRAHDHSLGDVAATLAKGRSHYRHRLAMTARSREGAALALENARPELARDAPERTAWLFTGQGSQRIGMGRELAAEWPVFRRELEAVAAALDPHLDTPLLEVMWGGGALLDRTQYTQPALFALEAALAALWRSWGLQPHVLIGHSVGELAAAYVAGVFTLEDAARFVAARARSMQALPAGGAMVSIAASEAAVAEALEGTHVSLAAINGPESVVISGAEDEVDAIATRFSARGVRTARLIVSHAFHSALMDPMLDELRKVLDRITFSAPAIPLVSNVSGAIAHEIPTADYWIEHVRRSVRFADGVRAADARVFLELGPKPTLLGLVPSCVSQPVLLASLRAERPESETMLEALGGLHVRGAPIDWSAVFPERARGADLPTYPWQRQSYWLERRRSDTAPGMTSVDHPLLDGSLQRPDGEEHLFTGRLSCERTPWLSDHRVFQNALFPGTGFLEAALSVGRRLGLKQLVELTLSAPLAVPHDKEVPLQIWVQRTASDRCSLAIYSSTDGAWTCHAKGVLARGSEPKSTPLSWPPSGASSIDLSELYPRLAAFGLHYGPAFRGLKQLWRDGSTLYAAVELPHGLEPDGFALHPALLDAALHALPTILEGEAVSLPFEWRHVEFGAGGCEQLMVRLEIREQRDGLSKIAIEARDRQGQVVLRAGELVLRAAGKTDRALLHHVRWEPLTSSPAEIVRAVVLGGNGALARRLGLLHVADASVLRSPPPLVIVDATLPHEDLLRDAHESAHRSLALLQAWLGDERMSTTELAWVTQGAIAAGDDPVDGLSRAALWGLVRSARRENPLRSLRLLDVEAESTTAQIMAALAVREPELALRGIELRAPRLSVAPPSESRRAMTWIDGTVVVTGASGSLGALVARHLVVRHGARNLLLLSRREAARLAEELTDLGALVKSASCDVSDRAALAAVLSGVDPVRAVFHCAGIVDDGALPSLDAARIDRVFAPKVDAAIHLHELTKSLELLVLFSSVSGIIGAAGQANYAAANTFLDALAAHRSRRGLPTQSLAWGLWEPSNTGMTSGLSRADLDRIRRQGIAPLTPAEGLELLDRAIEREDAVLVPARLALAEVVRPPPPRSIAIKERLSRLAPAEQLSALLELVRSEIGAVCRLSSRDVPDDEPLKSLGLDSLMALELRDRLGTKLDAPLPATLAFDHPTPKAIARFVESMLLHDTDDVSQPATVPLTAIDELTNEELASLIRSL